MYQLCGGGEYISVQFTIEIQLLLKPSTETVNILYCPSNTTTVWYKTLRATGFGLKKITT